MLRRPLVLFIGLTVADYLLWNWSLNGGHDVLSLIAGLSLPPLVLASAWLAVLAAMRMLVGRSGRVEQASVRRSKAARTLIEHATTAPDGQPESAAPTGAAGHTSGKLAA